MIIGNKFSGYSRDNIRLYPMDGGGSSSAQPSSTTNTTTSIPTYAQPYVETMLGKTEALSNTPYQTYDRERIAGFTPMQQQAFQGAQGMQTSGATNFGAGLAGAAGLGALGAQYDPTQFQSGQFGQQDAQQYMSPYMQSVVDIQQREAQRQGDIAGTQRAAQATISGAFGGSRQAIMDSEAARNLALQKGDIQAQGLQSSYQQAQNQFNADQARRMQAQQLQEQSKQYGAGYGMQGLQTALQGAGQLGALGGQQFAQGMDINKLQSQYGGQQQAQEQNIMGQQYQDFQNQQNYPYKQLGFMSDMLRGLPLSQASQQMYQQQPSALSQVAGLAPVAYGLSRMAGYAEGGITGDANVSSILKGLTDPQLEQAKQIARQNRDEERVKEIEGIQRERASARAGISAAAQQDQEPQSGIASAASDSMMDRMLPTEEGMARGGIVAFAEPTEDNNYSLITDPQFGGSTGEIAENRPKPTRDQVNAIVQALRDDNQPVGLSTIMDIEAGKITAPNKAAVVAAAPAAIPDGGLGGTREAKQAAALPPDISTMGGGAGGAGVSSGSTDFGKMFDATRARMDKAADPFAEETRLLGVEGVAQMQAKKERLVADQAKQTNVFSERKGQLEDRAKAIGKREAFNEGMAFISMGAAMMTEPGNIGKVLGKGIKVGSEQYIAGMDKIERSKELLADSREKLADLERDRSDMSLKEIRAAEDDIGTAQLNAKKMMLQGRKDLGAKNDAKSLAVFESEVKQQLAREAQRAAAATANKPGEMERAVAMMSAIKTGKLSFDGKTGEEGARAYKDSMGEYGAAKYGARYTGPAPKPVAYSPGDKALAETLARTKGIYVGRTDKVSIEKLRAIDAQLTALENKYSTRGGGGGGARAGAGAATATGVDASNPLLN